MKRAVLLGLVLCMFACVSTFRHNADRIWNILVDSKDDIVMRADNKNLNETSSTRKFVEMFEDMDGSKDTAVMTVPEKIYDWVKTADSEKGLIWLDPVKFNNTYTLMMNKAESEKLGIKSISDLGVYVSKNTDKLIFALDSEFWERPDGFKGIMKTYKFKLPPKQVKKMTVGLTYQALKEGLVNSAMGFATDGRIAAFGFVNLEDDKSFFPVYNPVPVVRKEILDTYPEIQTILKPMADNLNTEEMQQLNKAVDVDHKQVHDVAMDWLKSKNLIK